MEEVQSVFQAGSGFLKEAKEKLIFLEEIKVKREQYEAAADRAEKNLEQQEKSLNDEINSVLRARKEDVTKSYEEQLSIAQTKLKKAKSRRDKAKTRGMEERFKEETADIREKNRKLNTEIKTMFKKNKIPQFCNTKFYYSLYFTKWPTEILILILTLLVCFLVVPLGIYYCIPQRETFHLVAVFCITAVFVFALYILINNRTKVAHRDVLKEARKIRDSIRANNRKIHAIKNSIKKDKSEGLYNLESFNEEIKGYEEEINDIGEKMQDALQVFEKSTKHVIIEELKKESEEKIENLKADLKEDRKKIRKIQEEIRDVSIELTSKYEVYLGREFMQTEKLDRLIEMIEEGRAVNVSEAIRLYKGEEIKVN
jgi:hypothetical protein